MALVYPLLTETVFDLIANHIKANFNNELKKADNKYSDGISLEPVSDSNIYINESFESLNLPAIYILFEEHAFQYSNNPNYLNASDRVMIVLSTSHVDGEKIQRKIWRYARVLYGILNLVDLQDDQDRIKLTLIPQRLGYTKTVSGKLSKQEQRFRKDCVIDLDVKHFEKFLTDTI